MGRLTVEQQVLVEQNHNLIYDFAKKRNLIIEEYYDILAIGICKAALIYDKDIGEFSTVAYKCMDTELGMHWRYLQSQKQIPDENIVSYDAPFTIDGDESPQVSYLDLISSKSNLCYNLNDEIISDINYIFFENLLTENEKLIVKYIADGLTQQQIANKLGCTQQNIFYNITKIRKKWNLYNGN